MNTPSTAVSPGLGGFLAFFILAIALWLLMRNMNARMRRMSYRAEEQARRAEESRRAEEATQAGGGRSGKAGESTAPRRSPEADGPGGAPVHNGGDGDEEGRSGGPGSG